MVCILFLAIFLAILKLLLSGLGRLALPLANAIHHINFTKYIPTWVKNIISLSEWKTIWFISSIPIIIPIFCYVILLPTIMTYEMSTYFYQKSLDTFLENGCQKIEQKWNRCYQLFDGDKVLTEGLLIQQSETHISIFTKNYQATRYKFTDNMKLVRSYTKGKSTQILE